MDLVSLPRETLRDIISLDLSRQDLRSLRLTCHQLEVVTTPVLFYSIRISSLHRDRSSFFNIAKTFPYLVRVVIWEELNGDLDQLEDPSPHGTDPELSFFQGYISETRALFESDSGPKHCECCLGSLEKFRDAVCRMSNLHTFVSQPMSPRRELTLPGLGYTVTVEMINHLVRNEKRTDLNNLGFLRYIIPTLKVLVEPPFELRYRHPLPRITRLFYADEGFAHFTALNQLKESDAIAFSTLCHLDLCMAGVRCRHAVLEGFEACLRQACNLTSLKLCQEACSEMSEYEPNPSSHSLLSLMPRFPSLTELHLVDIDLDGVDRTLQIVKLIRHHAQTLKRVYINSMYIEKWALRKLAKKRALKLDRFVVTSREDIDDDDESGEYYGEDYSGCFPLAKCKNISEEVALAFINRNSNPHGSQPLLPYDRKDRHTELHTNDAIFDIDNNKTAAICETRDNKWMGRGYDSSDVRRLDFEMRDRRDEHGIAYDIGARRINDPVTGLWIDSNGVFYNPVTDEEIEYPESRSYEPDDDSWATQWQRIWDPKLGLWRDGENGRLKKHATDRDTLEIPESQPETDPLFEIKSEEDLTDMRAICVQDDEEFCLRVEMAPRWDWGRDTEGRVWFWKVSGAGGHATEVWYFEHKGEHAYGHEPLEFWHDWFENGLDSSRAEATPYGWNLSYFVTETNEIGSKIPSDTCDSLSMYEPEKDPMEGPLYEDMKSVLPFPADFEVHAKMKWTDAYFETYWQ
ncbi:hypothetical protein ACHAPU_003321 [Fusarium lateritium]